MDATAIVWLRQDLRTADNPALDAAARRHDRVVPVYVLAPDEEGEWPPGAASRWWLHHSLAALGADLARLGSPLVLRAGASVEALRDLARATGARAIHWNRRCEPAAVARDARVEAALRESGLEVETFQAGLLFEPARVATRQGGPFRVFTPFWRKCLSLGGPGEPLPAPARLAAPARAPASLDLDALGLLPAFDWAGGLRAAWTPGERGAARELDAFLDEAVAHYASARDRPGVVGGSRLSPHLHFGEIGPRRVWHAVRARGGGGEAYLRQLGWREFAHHLLLHFPHTPAAPLQAPFAEFPWRVDERALRAWQRGRTGYPLVDAGMRELWETGWMHNRVRMVAASFLVKHLLVSWRDGARWFWDTLVDADLANNTLGWQWTAGCGADAAPFFRVFNPVAQGERFDPDGRYVRRRVPEIARLPARWLHAPWTAPAGVLHDAGVALGRDYPAPIVEHAAARRRALAAYDAIRKGAGRR